MIDLENFEEHLKQLTKNDWQKLFDFIPKIKKTKDFGDYINSDPIVSETLQCIYALNIVPVFNWVEWLLGRDILTSKNYDFTTLNAITLCKVLTCIIRSNRYNEGYSLSCFKDKTIEKILINLKKEVHNTINPLL